MDNYSTNLLEAIENGLTLTEILRMEVQRLLNMLLKMELTSFLDYEKYDPKGYNTGNSRNGYYERTMNTMFGEIVLSIPRDRNGEFSNKLLSPYKHTYGDLEKCVIFLYRKGTTTREISDLIEKLYGCHYSPQTVSNMTQVVQQEVEKFHSRQLAKRYIAIYCDATYIPLKRDNVEKEALHVLLGVTEDGRKEVLDYTVAPHENNNTYLSLLESIKQRGVEDVMLFITDGFLWLDETCRSVFPQAKHQCCWVHIGRNIRNSVRKSDWLTIKEEIKEIYTSETRKEAVHKLGEFLDKWYEKYPKLADKLYDITDLFNYMLLPERIRKSFYTTNALEGLNSLLKRYVKKKEQFPDENSLERFVCSVFCEYNNKAFFKVAAGFTECCIEFDQLFAKLRNGKLNFKEEVYT